MDRAIEKKLWTPSRVLMIGGALIALIFLATLVFNRSGSSRLSIDSTRLTIAKVAAGEFREYYPFDGTVLPETSVFLDVEEGGRVDQIHTEGGKWVEEGDLILSISNTALQRNSIDTETRLLEQLDQIANTQFNRAQNSLILKDSLLDLEFRIINQQKKYDRLVTIAKRDKNLLKEEDLQLASDELEYLKNKRDLLQRRIKQEDLLTQRQLTQAQESEERLGKSLELLTKIVESLDIRAPISGYLSSIDAEVGQRLGTGQRIGQIDKLDKFKIRVAVDQYYNSLVQVGTEGHFRLDNKNYPVVVRKVYPEIVDNSFAVDVDFASDVPSSIQRGQRINVELNFGEPVRAVMLKKGGFYQSGGKSVYVVSADGKNAQKVSVRLGRQNPLYVEVLEGLKEGDWVITSSYDTFNNIDQLVFDDPIKL